MCKNLLAYRLVVLFEFRILDIVRYLYVTLNIVMSCYVIVPVFTCIIYSLKHNDNREFIAND